MVVRGFFPGGVFEVPGAKETTHTHHHKQHPTAQHTHSPESTPKLSKGSNSPGPFHSPSYSLFPPPAFPHSPSSPALPLAQAFAELREEVKRSWVDHGSTERAHLAQWPSQFREDLAIVYPTAYGGARSKFPCGMQFCCIPKLSSHPLWPAWGPGGRGRPQIYPSWESFQIIPLRRLCCDQPIKGASVVTQASHVRSVFERRPVSACAPLD